MGEDVGPIEHWTRAIREMDDEEEQEGGNHFSEPDMNGRSQYDRNDSDDTELVVPSGIQGQSYHCAIPFRAKIVWHTWETKMNFLENIDVSANKIPLPTIPDKSFPQENVHKLKN
eukprot:CAMPEP_0195539318 /NCGR_PEP_ID=MMETSP0794_2-20130614/49991_1 /TAXON_ID=515487 /ORGANISM="Stephanopyxis turris, Strain CCMP 815" /LENGTH=114 /DNA_ID=CAMNT_0040673343 /DNA_START=2627 /DNA_END=2971 /DNA_ORIENTATION=+